jgi:hypothetical protein
VRETIEGAEELKPEPPRPLMRKLPPADLFPVEALGDVLSAAASAVHDRVQAPLAICGQSVLGAAALAAQGHVDVELPIGEGRAKPSSLYLLTVAETGERKTACDTEALSPIRHREKTLRERYDLDLPDYINDKAAWEKAREKARRRKDRAAIKEALDALGPAPVPPFDPLLTCPEPTFEGLCKLFGTGWPSLGIFATEGGQFVGGHAMSDDARLRTAAGLSALWDGEPIKRVRSGDGVSVLPGRRLTTHLMVQPVVADRWFRDALLVEQGLLSRFLITAPDSVAGTRFHHRERPETARDLKRYNDRLLQTLRYRLPLAEGKRNELRPPRLVLSAVARKWWFECADGVESEIGAGGMYEQIRGFENKIPEHAARLAAVLTLVRDIDADEVMEDEMDAGIILAEHYANEASRLFGASQISGHLRLAQRLLNWLLTRWREPNISLPDIYQRSLNAIGDKATAARLVTILEDHGWLAKIPQGAVVAGQRRRDAWRIVEPDGRIRG